MVYFVINIFAMKNICLLVFILFDVCLSCPAQQWTGLQTLSGPTYENGSKIIGHPSGSKYVVGNYQDLSMLFQMPSPTFNCQLLTDPSPQIPNYGAFGFIIKYNELNEIEFIRTVPNGISDIVFDQHQNYYIIGLLSQQTQLNNTIHNAIGNEGILMAYDSEGNLKWWRIITCGGSVNSSSTAMFHSMDITAQGDVLVSGRSNIPGTLLPNFGIQNGSFLMKFDSTGLLLNYRPVPGNKIYLYEIKVDQNDDIYLGGNFKGTGFANGSHSADYNSDGFLAKMDKNFNEIWFKQLGTDSYGNNETVRHISVYNGNIYFASKYFDQINIDGTYLDIYGDSELYVASVDTSGHLNWATRIGGDGDEWIGDISVNSSGVYLTGSYSGRMNSIDGDIEAKGGRDMFFIRIMHQGWTQEFIPFGKESFIRAADYYNYEMANGIFADESGSIWVTGQIVYGGNIGNFSYTTNGITDCFIAQYSEDGNVLPIEVIDCTLPSPELNVYPNPATDNFRISSSERIEQVQIFDVNGKMLATFPGQDNETPYNIEHYSTGVYVLKILTTYHNQTIRIVKM